MAIAWLIVAFCGVFVVWVAWECFCFSAMRKGWWRGDAWVPRVADVQIALDGYAGVYRPGRCVKCGSSEVRTESSGLWDGFDADGARTGGMFWYGECEACGCRMGNNDDEPAYVVDEEEWDCFTRTPGVAERRKLEGPAAWPKTVKEAVRRLVEEMPADERDFVRGMPSEEDLSELHFGLGLGIRNGFGLWGRNRDLLADCAARAERDEVGADAASFVILCALRERLIETASEAGMARARERWRGHLEERERRRDEEARKDERITSRRCPGCGRACPRYRETCKYCGMVVGREKV